MLPLNNKSAASLALAGLLALGITANGSIALSCCSVDKAEFSNTIGWAGETVLNGKIVHILGYQNKAVNRARRMVEPVASAPATQSKTPAAAAPTKPTVNVRTSLKTATSNTVPAGNAMLLPIPSRVRMTQDNFMDTSKYKDLLFDMKNAVIPPSRAVQDGTVTKGFGSDVQVFTKGMYTVVLAQNAAAIPGALSRVPAEKRPQMNKEIFDAYAKWYPGWTFALCCFNESVTGNDPLIWWYEPKNPHAMFFPALDAHDGHAPKLNTEVDVDHTLIVSSHKMPNWTANTPLSDVKKVLYSQRPAKSTPLGQLIPDVVAGRFYKMRLANGDFVFETNDVRGGRCNPMRKLPPGTGGNPETHVPGID